MPSPPLKPLTLGTSLSSLKPRFDVIPDGKKDATKLCNGAKKIYSEALVKLKEHDEECAYIYFMKYLNVVSYVRKRPDYEKIKRQLEPLIPSKLQYEALAQAERLSKSLQKRYEILSTSRESGSKSLKESVNIEPPDSSSSNLKENTIASNRSESQQIRQDELKANGLEAKESISSSYLLEKLLSDSSKVLIMDVRPSTDFSESHINFDVCFNIPDNIVGPGMSAAKLAEKLPPESKEKWKKRLDVDFLVLVDWFSSAHNLNPDTKLACLKKIILEWDPSVTYRSKPLVLDGGYEEFLNSYPMKCTNAKPHIPHQQLEDQLCIDDVNYPVFIDEVPSPDKAPVSLFEPKNSGPVQSSSNLSQSLSQLSIGSQTSIPIVDRRSKAAALEKYREQLVEIPEGSEKLDYNPTSSEKGTSDLIEQGHQNLHSHAKQLLPQQDNQLQDYSNSLEKKKNEQDAENNNPQSESEYLKCKEREDAARKIPKPNRKNGKNLGGEKDFVQENTSPEKEDNHDDSTCKNLSISNENDGSKIVLSSRLDGPSTHSAASSLTRSRSSPNIAQLDLELDSDMKSTPQFDRTTKPSVKKLQYIEHSGRSRNFHEVYGTVKGGLTGLKNLGNSCYMNSILQCMSNTSKLMKYFCTGNYKDSVNRNPTNPTRGEVAEEVAQVVRNLWMAQYRSIACRDLKAVVGQHMNQFRGSMQQDSHEFLTFLLDWLHNDLKKNSPKVSNPTTESHKDAQAGAIKAWDNFLKQNDSFILRLFFVQQVSTVSCDSCHIKSYTYEEPTSNLTLLLPNASRCSLLDCFRLYTNRERISGYKCESCHVSRDAEKKVDLCRLPPVLVIHLKRFYSDGFYQKRQTFVDFPLTNLDLREFTLDKEQEYTSYDLYGVSNHYGTLEGGHYTAFCRNGSKWFKFDDQDVSEISPSDVKSPYAYILFYEAM